MTDGAKLNSATTFSLVTYPAPLFFYRQHIIHVNMATKIINEFIRISAKLACLTYQHRHYN